MISLILKTRFRDYSMVPKLGLCGACGNIFGIVYYPPILIFFESIPRWEQKSYIVPNFGALPPCFIVILYTGKISVFTTIIILLCYMQIF